MGTLNTKLTLTGTSADFGAALSLSVEKGLDVIKPYGSISKLNVTTETDADGVAAPNIILKNVDARRSVYIRHNGIDSSGAAVTTDLLVKNFEGETSANGTQIMALKKDEFALFPYDNGVDPSSADDNILILQASSGTINVDFAVFTVAS